MRFRRSDRETWSDTAHELIHGPMASGKTGMARVCLEEGDIAPATVESWVVDPFLGLAECARKVDRYARDFDDIDELLASLLAETFTRAERMAELGLTEFTRDARHGLRLISVTIEDADSVLRTARRALAVEQTMRMAKRAGIRFRLVVPNLSIGSFGCSEVIRSTATSGRIFPCERATA